MRPLLLGFAMLLATVPAFVDPAGATVVAATRLDTETTLPHDQPVLPRTGDSSPPYVMIALTTVLVAGGCLYLLFRRGSLAHRARQDEDGTADT
jgi:LPXTG-motif cell wall-anchored protein